MMIAKSTPIELYSDTEVLAVRRNSDGAVDNAKSFDSKTMEFDKIIISGSFPLKYGRTYHHLQFIRRA